MKQETESQARKNQNEKDITMEDVLGEERQIIEDEPMVEVE